MKERITVFTPTFNREKSLHRVYESLIKQTYKDFVWIVVDDGSTDMTKKLIQKYISEGLIKIKYYYQNNSGKHVAINTAIKVTDTELFLIADSDDAFTENALETFIDEWDSIQEKNKYKGITVRCYDQTSMEIIGKDFPKYRLDVSELEGLFKYKLKGEKWSIFRTEVLREIPFPEIEGLKFYPETIIWQKIARKYITRYLNIPLRIYYRDQDNALTKKVAPRYKENIFLWTHLLNNVFDYFFYEPKLFLKACVGLSRDGILNNYSYSKIIKIPNKIYKKILVAIFYPIGYILAKKRG